MLRYGIHLHYVNKYCTFFQDLPHSSHQSTQFCVASVAFISDAWVQDVIAIRKKVNRTISV
jgi:hypothetical protein